MTTILSVEISIKYVLGNNEKTLLCFSYKHDVCIELNGRFIHVRILVRFLYSIKVYIVFLTHSFDSQSIYFPEQYNIPLLKVLTREHNHNIFLVPDTFLNHKPLPEYEEMCTVESTHL